MKKQFIGVLLFVASFFGGNAFGQDVVFVGGVDSSAYETREFGEAVGANVTIPLSGNLFQKLFTGYSAERLYEQFVARGFITHPPVIIAHSLGGRILCRMLAEHPEFVPAKVIFVGSPLGELPGSPPSWLFAKVSHRSDIPTYVMGSRGDETIGVSSATAFPYTKETVVLESVGHTGYFSDANASARIRAWVGLKESVLLSAR